jgi:hypothetical protein
MNLITEQRDKKVSNEGSVTAREASNSAVFPMGLCKCQKGIKPGLIAGDITVSG